MNSRYTNLFRIFFSFLDICTLNLVHLVLILVVKIDMSISTYSYLLLFVIMNIS